MRRFVSVLALLTLGLLLLGACAGGDSPETELTVVAHNSSVGRAHFSLSCDPPSGDVPNAAAACRALAKDPKLVRDPQPFVCFGGTFSWWEIEITGRFGGEPVDIEVSSCWTPQMALIGALGISKELDRHVDPLSRPAYLGSGIPRSALADSLLIPPNTPGWLLRLARLRARALGDERPDRMQITLGDPHVVRLAGSFVCELCSRPSGARPPKGSQASFRVDPKTRAVLDFSLHGER